MKLPNWVKITWWAVLTVMLTGVMYLRSTDLIAGRSTAFDLVAFVVWVALLLVPIFAEISLWGMTLKAHVDEAKRELSADIASIRNEIRNDVSFNPTVHFPLPPTDAQLPQIKAAVAEAIAEAARASIPSSHLREEPQPLDEATDIDPGTALMFNTRLQIEREVRRIAEARGLQGRFRFTPVSQVLRSLVREDVIESLMANAIREVYSVCSPAVHGEKATEAQLNFVKDVAPELLTTLRSID